MLISQTIRGEIDPKLLPSGSPQGSSAAVALSDPALRQDLSLYPADMSFLDTYAEKQSAQVLSEDAMLQQANQYFKEVNKREREMNHAAVEYIKKLKAINRRGGDKDGFRYVLPTSVKQVVRDMMAKQGNHNEYVDPEMLISNFGGDDVKDGSDRPIRKKRRGPRRHNDFYQFQVSKQWTKNAENFLRKGRANKSMFEAKKRQRSIKKL
ncbi:hypothetical protein STCU_06815 [Strigomonas culicis]|uniref:Uncharacterized protein n=1 Tax=Strigomonas culicis TaxID=28005 RepID=S9VPH4_9TRYP|nr:hypothetical protein STCU_06815 [Strigomonas culicis]|eukprot:EPY25155.1 hypothetical protein STCU_06815 [Strigomonas culicis]